MAVVEACSAIIERMWDVDKIGTEGSGDSIVTIEVLGERP